MPGVICFQNLRNIVYCYLDVKYQREWFILCKNFVASREFQEKFVIRDASILKSWIVNDMVDHLEDAKLKNPYDVLMLRIAQYSIV